MGQAANLLLLAGVGLIAGFVNVVAGGGSFLTLPVLIFTGLPAPVANGTNRIAILIQNLFAALRFRQLGVLPLRFALAITAPAVGGAVLGALVASGIEDILFRRILAAIMIAVTLFSLYFRPSRRLSQSSNPSMTKGKWAAVLLAFFFVGFYGGFVQAGVGFLFLSVMVLTGYDLVRANAIKVFVVFLFTILALAIFISKGQVNFVKGLALAVGNTVGGQLGAVASVRRGERFIQKFVTAAIFVFAIKLILS